MSQSKSQLLTRLRVKKQGLINQEESIRNLIKEYFSQATISLMQQERKIDKQLQYMQLQLFQQLQTYIEGVSNLSNQEIYSEKIVHEYSDMIAAIQSSEIKLVVNCQKQEYEELFNNLVGIAKVSREYQIDMTEAKPKFMKIKGQWNSMSPQMCNFSQEKTTNKKGMSLLGEINNISIQQMKQSYEHTIKKMEQKVQYLMINQAKLQRKISIIQAKLSKSKKGQYKEKENQDIAMSSLKLQRLQSENQILIQQIAQCSEKLLKSEGSILASLPSVPPQFPPTEKKKKLQLIDSVQEVHSILTNQALYNFHQKEDNNAIQQQSLYSPLSSDPTPMLKTVSSELQNTKVELQSVKTELIRIEEKYKQLQSVNRDLEEYTKVLHKQVEENIDKKIEYQDKYIALAEINKSIQIQLTGKMKTICGLEESLRRVEEQRESLLIKLNKLEQNNMKIRNEQSLEMNSLNIEMKSIAQELNETKKKMEEQKKQCQKYKEEIKLNRAELVESERERQKLMANNEKFKTEAKKLEKEKEKDLKKMKKQNRGQLKQEIQKEREILNEEFSKKYGETLDKMQMIRKQLGDIREFYEKRGKIFQNRIEIFKTKIQYDFKDMLDKLSNTSKNKLTTQIMETLTSYIESQSTLSLKSAQIKQLKDQIQTLKKVTPKITMHSSASYEQVEGGLQTLQKQLSSQKYEAQKRCYESTIDSIREEYESILQESKRSYVQMESEAKQLKKIIQKFEQKELLQNKEKEELMNKKNERKIEEKHQKLQSLASSYKNQVQKLQQEMGQVKEQLRLKKEYVSALKKQMHAKQLEKQKLNKTIDQLMEANEKLKIIQKQKNKKDLVISDLKAQINETRTVQEDLQYYRRKLETQQKNLRAEINAKECQIRQMRNTEEQLRTKLKGQKVWEEQNADLKDKLRKTKAEVERKDQLLQYSKNKNQKMMKQLEQAKEEEQRKRQKAEKNLQVETSKLISIKNKTRKLEGQVQLMRVLMVRIYTKISEQIENNFKKSPNKRNEELYSTHAVTKAYTSPNRDDFNTINTVDYKGKFEFSSPISQEQHTNLECDPSLYTAGLSILGMDLGDLMIGQKNTHEINETKQKLAKKSQMDERRQIEQVSVSPNKTKKGMSPSMLIELLDKNQLDCDKILNEFEKVLEGKEFFATSKLKNR